MNTSKEANGYHCIFAEKSIPEDFYCKKCSLVARGLTVSSCCGESFCGACMEAEKGKPCPQCGSASFTTMELVKYHARILNLKVFCSMKERGCDWCGSLQLLDAHLDPKLDNCRYVDVQCPLGCLQILPKFKMDHHMFNECMKRSCACKFCGFRGSFEDVITKHIHICEHFPIKCPNTCGVTCKRSEMKGHRNVCPKEVVKCPNSCGVTVKRSEMGGHRNVCPEEVEECVFSSLGCKVKYKRADKEEHSNKNLLKHLDFAVEAIKSLLEVSQKNTESQTVKELKKELQKMEKKYKQQNKQIEEQNTRLRKLEKLLHEPGRVFDNPSKLIGIKRPRTKSEPEETVKFEDRGAGSNRVLSEILSAPVKSEEYSGPPRIKSEVKLPEKFGRAMSPQIKSEEEEVKPNLGSNPPCTEPEDMEVEKPVQHKQYVSEFTLENFSKEKAKDEPNKLDTPPMYTQDCGYKFTIGIDANGFGSSRGKAMRVWMKSLPGEYDDQLKWPAKVSFQIELIGNNGAANWTVTNNKTWIKPSATSGFCQSFTYEPTAEYVFIDHCRLGDYICNDALRFKITPGFVIPQPNAGP